MQDLVLWEKGRDLNIFQVSWNLEFCIFTSMYDTFELFVVEIDHHFSDHGDDPPSATSTCSEDSVEFSSDEDSADSTLQSIDWEPVRERRMSYDFFSFPSEYDSATYNLGTEGPATADEPETMYDSKCLKRPRSMLSGDDSMGTPTKLSCLTLEEDSDNETQTEDGTERKIGAYTREERKARIKKFHAKRQVGPACTFI